MLKQLLQLNKILADLENSGVIRGFGLIGAMALGTWIKPRATDDIDLLVLVDATNKTKFFEQIKTLDKRAELRTGDAFDPVGAMIVFHLKGVKIDLILVSKTFERESLEHLKKVHLDGQDLHVVDPYYLTILKLKASGPKDLLDVETLARSRIMDKQVLFVLAEKFKVSNKLKRIYTRTEMIARKLKITIHEKEDCG